MHATEKEIEKYLSEIRVSLVCSSKLKNEIISEIEGFVYDFAEHKEIRDISEIYEHFGTPEEMAKTYLSQADPKEIKRAVNVRKVVVIGITVALLMLAGSLLISLMDAHKSYNSSYKSEYVNENSVEESYTIN